MEDLKSKLIKANFTIEKNKLYSITIHESVVDMNKFKLKSNQKFIKIRPTENDELYKITVECKKTYKRGQKDKIDFFENIFKKNEEAVSEPESESESEPESESETEYNNWVERYKNNKEVEHSGDNWLER